MSALFDWRKELNRGGLPATLTAPGTDPDSDAARLLVQQTEVLGGMLDRIYAPDLLVAGRAAQRDLATRAEAWVARLSAVHAMADRAAREAENWQMGNQAASAADFRAATVTVDPRVGPVAYALRPEDECAVPLVIVRDSSGALVEPLAEAPAIAAALDLSNGGTHVLRVTARDSLPPRGVIAPPASAVGNQVQAKIEEGTSGGQPAVLQNNGAAATYAAVAGTSRLNLSINGTPLSIAFGSATGVAGMAGAINAGSGGVMRAYYTTPGALLLVSTAVGGTVFITVLGTTDGDVLASLGLSAGATALGTGTYRLSLSRGDPTSGLGRVETYDNIDPLAPVAAYFAQIAAINAASLLASVTIILPGIRPSNVGWTHLMGGFGGGQAALQARLARAMKLSYVVADPDRTEILQRFTSSYAAAWTNPPALDLGALDRPVGSPPPAIGLPRPDYTVVTAIADLRVLCRRAAAWGHVRSFTL